MRKAILAVLASVVLATAAMASAPGNATVPIHRFINILNSGDVKTAWKISSWTWSGVKPHPAK